MTDDGIIPIRLVAEEAAEHFVLKNNDYVHVLFERATILGGPYGAGLAFIVAFGTRAADAREANHQHIVSRLKEGAYRFLPQGEDKDVVNDIFRALGACGHRQKVRAKTTRTSTLQTVKG